MTEDGMTGGGKPSRQTADVQAARQVADGRAIDQGSVHAPQPSREPPEGWIVFPIRDGFIGTNGPLYVRKDGDGMVLGMRVEERHCNPNGACHGGMLMTFADMLLPIGARVAAKMPPVFLPTISLSMDYLAPAPLGAWIEGRARVLRVTRNLVFADGLITTGDATVARTSGTFKIGKALPGLGSLDDLLARS